MSVNVAKLKSNPRGLNEIFFSGSQSVTKGDEVTWVLDETFAFQATEDCKVSTNASPFVEISAGDIFIIYKRTQEDNDQGNSKGLYIFDRDTVLRLAYPQENTQDIVIQNDNYNNNLNTVIVEADKTPVAKITLSNSQPALNEVITVSGASSYAIAPAIIAEYKWVKNGTHVSSASSFTYTNTSPRQDDISLIITDSDGKKGNTASVVSWQDSGSGGGGSGGGSLQDITYSLAYKYSASYHLQHDTWKDFNTFQVSNINGVGKITVSLLTYFTLKTSADVNLFAEVYINGVRVAHHYGKYSPSGLSNRTIKALTTISSYNGAIHENDTVRVRVKCQYDSQAQDDVFIGWSEAPQDTIQIKLTNRTA